MPCDLVRLTGIRYSGRRLLARMRLVPRVREAFTNIISGGVVLPGLLFCKQAWHVWCHRCCEYRMFVAKQDGPTGRVIASSRLSSSCAAA